MRFISQGIDMVDCARLQDSINRYGRRFLDRVYTKFEQDYSLGKKREIEHLAGRFAAKEAVLKVLGTGWTNGICWTDIEVRNEPSGQPKIILYAKCREIADQMGLSKILISISHIETHAIASAVGLAEDSGGALGIGD